MLLAIDARPRSVAVGIRPLPGGPWLALKRFGASGERSADEYAFLLEATAEAAFRAVSAVAAGAAGSAAPGAVAPIAAKVGEAWISSVSPALTPRLAAAVSTAFGIEARIVGPGAKTGLKIRTDQPSEVGSDLVCAALAGRELAAREAPGAPVLVVDFGAAIAISAVNAAGEFLGAAIAPGLETAAFSLHRSAALIPEVRLDLPARAIGRSTPESIRAGLLLGYGGLVERLVSLMGAELAAEAPGAPPPLVLGTGEAEGRSILEAAGIGRFAPELALEGIALVAARNRA
ncbi:MAG: type III pantothenate kinase [Spirochaetaceae bacterium]|nr:type III pantothenate kinase [Spirochaetaceae bacterium]